MNPQLITAQSELEHILFDESAEPKSLPLSLLEHMTNGFSDDNEIGYGGFARVYKGMLDNGIVVAVKKLLSTVDIDENKFKEEVNCLMKAKQKNIVRFLGYCSDTQGEMVHYKGKFIMAEVRQRLLCFEYLPKGSLDKQITDASCGLEWSKRYKIITGICDGLYYLHQKRILHLDLKPENILLDDNMMPKIADFGLSRCFDEKQSRAIASKVFGTMGYLAPEILFGGGQITFKSDIYSLGIIIIGILTGEKGYPCPGIDNVLERWRNRLEKSQRDTQLIQVRVCTEIARDCTDFNPEKRPDIQHISDRLGATKNVDESATEIGASSSSSVAQARVPKAAPTIPLENTMANEVKSAEELYNISNQNQCFSSMSDIFSVQQVTDIRETALPLPPVPASILPLPSSGIAFTESQSQWKKGKLLGIGTFSRVYLGFNSESGQFCAIREFQDDENSKEHLRQLNQEVDLLSQLSHQNIVQYYGSELTDEALSIYLEYVSGGSIHKLLREYGPFREPVIRNYTRQILSGLAYLHGRNTVHSDIKGANILVGPTGDVKLADFGVAKHITSFAEIPTLGGSPFWMAPEVIMNNKGYSLAVDIWSLGCTIIEMATARQPWHPYEDIAALFKIAKSKDTLKLPESFSKEGKDFLSLCLKRDPAQRPSAIQLLGHPFVHDHQAISAAKWIAGH